MSNMTERKVIVVWSCTLTPTVNQSGAAWSRGTTARTNQAGRDSRTGGERKSRWIFRGSKPEYRITRITNNTALYLNIKGFKSRRDHYTMI